MQLKITPQFTWHDRAHGGSLRWHLWVEDSDSEAIYHTEVRLTHSRADTHTLLYWAWQTEVAADVSCPSGTLELAALGLSI